MKIRSGSYTNELAIKLDESVSGTTYVGKAPVGAGVGDAVWQISKIVESAGVTTITWADGNSAFDNVWNNRASLTYL